VACVIHFQNLIIFSSAHYVLYDCKESIYLRTIYRLRTYHIVNFCLSKCWRRSQTSAIKPSLYHFCLCRCQCSLKMKRIIEKERKNWKCCRLRPISLSFLWNTHNFLLFNHLFVFLLNSLSVTNYLSFLYPRNEVWGVYRSHLVVGWSVQRSVAFSLSGA
jgi:hypothetical protein